MEPRDWDFEGMMLNSQTWGSTAQFRGLTWSTALLDFMMPVGEDDETKWWISQIAGAARTDEEETLDEVTDGR